MQRTPSGHDPLERFAAELRNLRLRAGQPSYRVLMDRTRFGRTTLSEALNGNRMPTWDVTRALVTALGGDESEWRTRWAEVATGRPAPESTPEPPGRAENLESDHGNEHRSPRRRLRVALLAVAVLTVGLAAVLVLSTGDDLSRTNETVPQKRTDSSQECMIVTARDVTVFVAARGDQSWTVWTNGTRFWAQPGDGSRGRLRTPMLNGRDGWVTGYERYVKPSDGCP